VRSGIARLDSGRHAGAAGSDDRDVGLKVFAPRH
jgi:hypothetical protein